MRTKLIFLLSLLLTSYYCEAQWSAVARILSRGFRSAAKTIPTSAYQPSYHPVTRVVVLTISFSHTDQSSTKLLNISKLDKDHLSKLGYYRISNGKLSRADSYENSSTLFRFNTEKDNSCYFQLLQVGLLNEISRNPYDNLATCLETITLKYKNDSYFKSNDIYKVVDRIYQIEELLKLNYLSHNPKTLDNAVIRAAINHKNINGSRPYFMLNHHLYDARECRKLLEKLGVIAKNMKVGFYDADLLVKKRMLEFQRVNNLKADGEFNYNSIYFLKQELIEIAELKKCLRKTVNPKLKYHYVLDKETRHSIKKLLPNEVILIKNFLTPSLKEAILNRFYELRVYSDNYAPKAIGSFIDDFYKKKAPFGLIGFFKEADAEYYIYRNNLLPNKKFFSVLKHKQEIKSVTNARSVLLAFSEHLEGLVKESSTDEISFGYIRPYSKGDLYFHLTAGTDTYKVPSGAMHKFITNKTAKPPKELVEAINKLSGNKPLIFFRDPIIQQFRGITETSPILANAFGENTWVLNLSSLIVRLQEISKTTKVFLASDFELATKNYNRRLKTFNNYVVANPGTYFKINDYRIMQVLASRIQKERFVNPKATFDGNFDLVLTIGHKNEELIKFYRFMNDSGFLKDRLPFNYSCYLQDEELWSSNVIRSSRSLGMVYYYRLITPDATRKVLLRFFENVGKPGYDDTDLLNVMKKIIDECAADPKNLSIKDDIESLRNTMIYQLSKINLKLSRTYFQSYGETKISA